ncbi:MAG: hypothetical protein MK160_01405 [Rhodobacteraceae bacterium]|nr:hypothetical protein [Paracoccaceae bacterium]
MLQSSEENVRIILAGPGGEYSIAGLCRPEGVSYKRSMDLMEAGKQRLAGETARGPTTDAIEDLHRDSCDLKDVVAEPTLELRLLSNA